jgi:hypothetical protein
MCSAEMATAGMVDFLTYRQPYTSMVECWLVMDEVDRRLKGKNPKKVGSRRGICLVTVKLSA